MTRPSSSHDEVRCQSCGKLWPASRETCPFDGTSLDETVTQRKPHFEWVEGHTNPDELSGTLRELDIAVASTHSSGAALPMRQLPSLAPGTRVGDYEIEKRIGDGAMSEVYVAVHPTIGRRVAIKLISPRLFADPEAKERFTSEARAVSAIHHPGIVDVFGFGTYDDGRAYLIMEWLSGDSLGARLRRGAVLFDDALDIIWQITNALRAAHEHGIVHRDLKPDNIFLQVIRGEKSVVKILDFGLATRTDKSSTQVFKSYEGRLVGTPLYMSPEQCRGKTVDHRADIYSLGCVCYELLTGQVPFPRDTVLELVAAHMKEPPPDLSVLRPEIPEQLARLLHATLAKDPNARPTLAALRRAIQRIAHTSQVMSAVGADPDLSAGDDNSDLRLPLPAPDSVTPQPALGPDSVTPHALPGPDSVTPHALLGTDSVTPLARPEPDSVTPHAVFDINDTRTQRERPLARRPPISNEDAEAATLDGNPLEMPTVSGKLRARSPSQPVIAAQPEPQSVSPTPARVEPRSQLVWSVVLALIIVGVALVIALVV